MTLDALALWKIFRSHVKIIFISAFFSGLLFYGIAYQLTPQYESESQWLPDASSSMDAASGIMSLVGLGAGNKQNNEAFYKNLFNSDVLYEPLLNRRWKVAFDSSKEISTQQLFMLDTAKFDPLFDYYTKQDIARELLLALLKKATTFTPASDGYALIVRTRDPLASQQINQMLLESLNEFNQVSVLSQYSRESDFLAERLNDFEKQLAEAEQRMLNFQMKNQGNFNNYLELQSARLNREITIQNSLVLEFRKQLELSLVQKEKGAAPLRIIKPPSLPINKAWPKRSLFAAIGLAFGFTLAYGFFLIKSTCTHKDERVLTEKSH